jgi:opacity protein-like surface antigen
MKKLFLVALAVCIASGAAAPLAAAESPEDAAQKAATTWLALVDAGKYGESWQGAAEAFKQAVTQAQWQGALEKVRAPLGKVVSRKLKSAKFTRELPGAPAGEYVVIQYDTDFKKNGATETVTPMKDKDGVWRVSGYFIKP